MTVTEPQFDPLQDDYDFVPTPEQQAMVEQRLAEMLADPNLGMTYEEMDQFLDNLEI